MTEDEYSSTDTDNTHYRDLTPEEEEELELFKEMIQEYERAKREQAELDERVRRLETYEVPNSIHEDMMRCLTTICEFEVYSEERGRRRRERYMERGRQRQERRERERERQHRRGIRRRNRERWEREQEDRERSRRRSGEESKEN